MRAAAAVLCWLLATAALAAAVPAGWAQHTIVSSDGYAALAQSAAGDPALQDAVAAELAQQVIDNIGAGRYEGLVRGAATAYTGSSAFPGQFADANRLAHQWAFTDAVRRTGDQWELDLAPMLSDTAFSNALTSFGVSAPTSVTVPVTDTTDSLRPGQLQPLARWGPWVSLGTAALTVVMALLTVAVAPRRGKAVTALGVSALLVGGGGWAALEIGRGSIDDALNRTSGNIRTIADVMVANAEGSLHQWLNLTLVAGGVLVVFGVVVTLLGVLRRKEWTVQTASATGTRTSEPT